MSYEITDRRAGYQRPVPESLTCECGARCVRRDGEIIHVGPCHKKSHLDLDIDPNWQTKARGTNEDEYEIYRACADDGKGGDITRNGEPLLSYDEWVQS